MSSTLQQPLLPLHSDKDGSVEDFGRQSMAPTPETVALADLWTTRGPPQYQGYAAGPQALKAKVTSVIRNSTFRTKCRQIGVNPTLQRLRIGKQSGLPPMRVLPAAWLKAQDGVCRIPRSHEGLTVDAEQAVCTSIVNKCRPVIVMVSHRWLDSDHDKPDDEVNSKAKALFEFAKWLEWRIRTKGVTGVPQSQHPLIFLWIDWPCINQGPKAKRKKPENCEKPEPGADGQSQPQPVPAENQQEIDEALLPYIECLSIYTACCHLVTCFEGAGPDDYGTRPWCLVERIAAYVHIPNGQTPFIVQDGFVHQQQSPTKAKRKIVDPLQYLDKVKAHDAQHIEELTTALLGRQQWILSPPCNGDGCFVECLRGHPTVFWACLTMVCMTFFALAVILPVSKPLFMIIGAVVYVVVMQLMNAIIVRIGATITALELRADSVVTEAPTSDEQDEDTVVFNYKRGDDEDEQREVAVDQVDPECREYREVDVQVV